MLDEGCLARPVSRVHGAYLRDGHMALIYEQQEVLVKKVDQARRPFSCFSPRQMHRVILNTIAETNLFQHF